MWNMLAEEQGQHFSRISQILGEELIVVPMEIVEGNDLQPKQERLRTRWTPALDKIFADMVVYQIQQGNRPNNIFDKKTWTQIREEFNKQTNLNFNNNQLRKHLDVLRTRYHSLQSTFNHNDPIQDPYVGFDLWEDIGAQTKIEPAKSRECPIYEQLCTIFADSGVDGKYAQSSHYKGLEKSSGIDQLGPDGSTPPPKTPSTSKFVQENESSTQKVVNNTADKKRKRSAEAPVSEQGTWNQELNDTMARTLSEMISSSNLRNNMKSRSDERFSITNCIKALDEIESIEDNVYYAALDLFENQNAREIFLSLKNNILRSKWLQGKCGNFAQFRS